MLLTFVFAGTAALFLLMTSAALFHLQWAKRLPALSELNTADPSAIRTANEFNARSLLQHVMKKRESKIRFAAF